MAKWDDEYRAETISERHGRALAENQPCPRCGAEVGQVCVSASGRSSGWYSPHAARQRAAEAKR